MPREKKHTNKITATWCGKYFDRNVFISSEWGHHKEHSSLLSSELKRVRK